MQKETVVQEHAYCFNVIYCCVTKIGLENCTVWWLN